MKFTELKEDLARGAGFCYLLEGEDRFFLERAEEMIRQRYPIEPSLNFTAFDGASLKGDRIAVLSDALQVLPFLSEKRIVKVTDFTPTEREYETYLSGLFASPVETTLLLLVNPVAAKRAGGVDWKKKPNVRFVDCSKADDATIVKWIYLTFRRAGVNADPSVCNRILRYCVSDMARISKETEKLISYVGAGGTVTEEAVDETVYPDADYKIYEMSNAIAVGNFDQAMKIIKDLLSKDFDEIGILNALAASYRTLYEVSVTEGSDAQAAKRLGMKEYAVRKNREQANRLGGAALKERYFALYDAISDIKAGKVSAKGALEKVIVQILF